MDNWKINITNKVILITGAPEQFTMNTAYHLAQLSGKLAIVSLDKEALKQFCNICEETTGLRPLPIIADVYQDVDIERIINETIEHYKQLDILVNNAGIIEFGKFQEMSMETYDKVMAANMRSMYYLTKLALPHLIETRGTIINIPVMPQNGLRRNAPSMLYHMTESALISFSRSLARELNDEGVNVNSMTTAGDYITVSLFREDDGKIEVGPHDVAKVIAFLATETGKTKSGENFVISLK